MFLFSPFFFYWAFQQADWDIGHSEVKRFPGAPDHQVQSDALHQPLAPRHDSDGHRGDVALKMLRCRSATVSTVTLLATGDFMPAIAFGMDRAVVSVRNGAEGTFQHESWPKLVLAIYNTNVMYIFIDIKSSLSI